ncbi:Glucan 1,3-beta-glucosidase 1 [Wickerhamomyces ciferrii]|uniref:glucan 1,3-beta-glucosidase n=1 Tax=Wickerhamomyces ciferrii (strain ATCC 14091 / BCRC 22168 / CBS 111 / JCM 3599 / NBRC 0793 / NRRL Y-1031 F-60-10) TaxID=1206466 RepID=K0KJH1_WICCF|nr:Glucan 1,3-beta-glucosidase 1 [Wickerhamomyces ciferrii]CCH45400.1 Glucan 1,3-beta-glucosidase 1 [Wickerhamomyces ciferrii]
MLLNTLILSVISLQLCSAFHIKRNLNGSDDSIWDYDDEDKKIQGVTFGGWFVLEPYITPSLFEQFGDDETEIPVDEYTFTQQLGKEEAQKQLDEHWATWYTEKDFKDAKNFGLNLIRLPIGYWAFGLLDDDPYVQGQEKYLDKAIEWAKENDLKVWVDLHGLPGSQNGFDNSGKRGNVTWQDEEENIKLSYKTLSYIFGKYGVENYTDTVIGIEIANEPFGPKLNITELYEFYYNNYYDFRVEQESRNTFVIHDAFELIGYWNHHLNNDYPNVSKPFINDELHDKGLSKNYFHDIVVDHHHYEVFSVEAVKESPNTRAQNIRNLGEGIAKEQEYHPSIVGEWSGAITDCAKWLNGVGTGARYDDTFNETQLIRANSVNGTQESLFKFKDEKKSCENVTYYEDFSDEHKEHIRHYIEIQLITYENTNAGWIFWNYKTETAIEWDFKKLVEKDLFPHPFDDYKYFYKNGTQISESAASSTTNSFSLFTITLIALVVSFIIG